MLHPEELSSRTCRWSVATGEILSAAREVHTLLRELNITDPEGDALVALVQLIESRATPPDVILSPDSDDDDGSDDGEPEPGPMPVILTPTISP